MVSLFSFIKKKQNAVPPLFDIHAHLLPGLDDGARTMEETILMIEQLKHIGYKKLVATPHIFYEYYPNDWEGIVNVWNNVKGELIDRKIDIELEVAAEYFLDEHFIDLLEDKNLLTLEDNHILVEVSTLGAIKNLDELIWKIKASGYCPILAHPERYLYLEEEDYSRLLSYGCKFQINLLALNGAYGSRVRARAFQLIKNNRVHFMGTDLHRVGQIKKINEVLQSPYFKMLPKMIVNRKEINHF